MSSSLLNRSVLAGINLAILTIPLHAHSGVNPLPIDKSSKIQQIAIPFVKNQGQTHPNVAYYLSSFGGTVFVDQQGALTYSLPKKSSQGMERWSFRESFLSQNKLTPTAQSVSNTQIQLNNKQGSHPVTVTDTIALGEVEQGIVVELHAVKNNVEKIFHVKPGSDPTNIKVKLDGINSSHLNSDGELVLETGLGAVTFTKPIAYQTYAGEKQNVAISYTLEGNRYGFLIGDYDKTHELIIDPLIASTYVGGNGGYPAYSFDTVYAIVPAGDYLYAAGATHSPNFPTALGYDSTFDGIRDGFVLRFTSDLSTLVNATFIGQVVYDLAVADNGEVIAVGQTGTGFPKTTGAYSYPSNYDQSGGFVAKFNADLTNLVAAGVVVPAPILTQVALGNGGIYFGGRHNVNNLPVTPGALSSACYCTTNGGIGQAPDDGFLGRLSADLSTLDALSWVGGVNVSDIAIAADSSVYFTDGYSSAIEGSINQVDANITTLLARSDFRALGSAQTNFYGVILGDGYVIAAGTTTKPNLPATSGAYDTTCGNNGACDAGSTSYASSDGFLVRYNPGLTGIQALSYLGGSGNDSINTITMDETGSILVAGSTGSTDYPTTVDAYQKKIGGTSGGFISKISNDLSTLQYSSYFAVAPIDIETDTNSIVYIAGHTSGTSGFPTSSGAFDTSYNGDTTDGFISKFDLSNGGGNPPGNNNVAPVANAGADQTVVQRSTVVLDGSNSSDSDGSIVAYQWSQKSGRAVSIISANSAVATFTAPRLRRGRTETLVFQLVVTDNNGATNSDQITVTVTP